ncbi:response regulator [Dyadobacter sp. CY323]|uniref:response regulator n=1 Tax=Dyadobacter sp. CY323 TaxID=2907302 RepID=UPI001F1C6F84|nr:response regulator [Dyadobacter sp. CY323]MCE6991274.1 response regulator [Dyadobacter sp. CY323]
MQATINILMIDDDLDDQHLIESAFKRQPVDCKWTFASDGLEGLEKLESLKSPPDLVLLDLNMPRMSGFDFLLALKRKVMTRMVPVIILSTSSLPQNVARAYQLGASQYYVKPNKVMNLEAVVSDILKFVAV